MKFQVVTCLAFLATLDQSNAFSPRSFSVSSMRSSGSSLKMSEAEDEIAKLRAAAAKAREEAAQLAKVSKGAGCFHFLSKFEKKSQFRPVPGTWQRRNNTNCHCYNSQDNQKSS